MREERKKSNGPLDQGVARGDKTSVGRQSQTKHADW